MVPALIFLARAWALEMSLVQMPAPRPYSESLATAAISSRSLNGAATRTGPKISSRTTFMSGLVLVSTAGSMKQPRSPCRPPPPSPGALDDQARASDAALAVVEEDRIGCALDGRGPGIVEDDVGALAAQFQGQLLQVAARCCRHDQLAYLGGAGEGDLVHIVVGGQRRAGGLAEAGHHVHHAIGHAGLGHQLRQPQRGQPRPIGAP